MRIFHLLVGFGLLAMLMFAPARADDPALAEAILQADLAGTETPRVSTLDPDIDLAGAYRVQQLIVDRRLADGDKVAGYKAGLTGKLARWWFKIDEPVFGVLLESGIKRNNAVIAIPPGRHMLLETEIVFIAGQRIDAPVRSVPTLKRMVRGVAPAIEIPAGGFSRSVVRRLKVTDIVANNVSAHALILGDERPVDRLDLRQLEATLTRDGKTLSQGNGTDAMGNPWDSALWLVNVAVARGRVVEPGQVLSTGVVGKRIEAEPGQYIADFGELGTIEFEVK